MRRNIIFIIVMILLGGIFITSERFMNIENDAKAYFIGVLLALLLLVCSISRKGLSRFMTALRTTGIGIGFSIVCMILSTYGLLQYFGAFPSRHYAFPITGTYENPAGFAAVQAALFPFAFYICFLNENKRWIRCFAGVTAVLCFVTVILSGSRAGVLAICAAATVVLVLQTNVLSVFKTHRWLWLPLILTIVTASVIMYRVKASSADGRLFVWSICLDMIKERPLFGYGIDGIEKHYMDAQAAYFSLHPDSPYVMLADNVTHPYNEYIKLTVNYGLTGLAMAFFFLVLTVKRLFKSRENVKVIGLAVSASVFVMCQFSYPFHYAAVWFIAAVAVLPAFFKESEGKEEWETPKYLRITLPILFSVLLAVVLRMMYLDLKWAEMSKRSLAGHTERMLPYYEKMKPQMQHNPLFLYNYAAELNYIGRYEESLAITEECRLGWNDYDVQMLLADNLENTGQIDDALDAYRHAEDMIPCRFEPLESMMTVYLERGDTLRAIMMAEEIINKPVKVQSFRVEQIRSAATQVLMRDME
ncbi:MAG: O-antigen ligase family protein [Bacteroidaceae bacterium]|nr:O-antigen ligase family protein [Bacteroidaceae bacterium]